MPNVMEKNLIIIKSIIVWKWNHLFMKNYCYGFMPGNFQVICGSMFSKNRRLLASAETSEIWNLFITVVVYLILIARIWLLVLLLFSQQQKLRSDKEIMKFVYCLWRKKYLTIFFRKNIHIMYNTHSPSLVLFVFQAPPLSTSIEWSQE